MIRKKFGSLASNRDKKEKEKIKMLKRSKG